MKKYIPLVLLPILLIGCVRKSEFEKSQSDLAAAQEKIKTLEQESASTHAMLEQAEAEIAQLKPLAAKARQLPISTRLDKHAANSGYNLFIYNQARTPLRLAITVTASGRSKNFSPVVDGGKFSIIPGLAPSDTVSIVSDGYDATTLTIK